ncbi:MAG: NTP transferase domain-containing protein [Muribaculum sp.]|nr:NTP transferase domain-containing protein [Muribaculum sp.]
MTDNKRNAIILAAGTASRFVPLSAEIPKGLLEVKGEILIERQIRQLQQAGIDDITIIVGYKAEMFQYLVDKFGVSLVLNEDFNRFNNTSSVIRVLDKLGNTYICSSDNYFPENVFIEDSQESFYSALFAPGATKEYCLNVDDNDDIIGVTIGGADSWYMIGHVYFSKPFSDSFKRILAKEYEKPETKQGYWEDVYIKFLNELPAMKIHRYSDNDIYEFDSIDELREFDSSYTTDTRSSIIKSIAQQLGCSESALSQFAKMPNAESGLVFSFEKNGDKYYYCVTDQLITKQL